MPSRQAAVGLALSAGCPHAVRTRTNDDGERRQVLRNKAAGQGPFPPHRRRSARWASDYLFKS